MEDSSCSRGTLKRARRFSSSQIHQLPLTPLPGHCPRQDWLRQSPVGEEEQLPGAAAQAGSQAGQSGSTDAAGRADVSPSLTGGAFPTHTPAPPSAKGPALRRELSWRGEHAVLSNPISSDRSRAGTCPAGSSPLCSCVQPAMLCN